jgi:hypothetical protein
VAPSVLLKARPIFAALVLLPASLFRVRTSLVVHIRLFILRSPRSEKWRLYFLLLIKLDLNQIAQSFFDEARVQMLLFFGSLAPECGVAFPVALVAPDFSPTDACHFAQRFWITDAALRNVLDGFRLKSLINKEWSDWHGLQRWGLIRVRTYWNTPDF